MMRYAVLILLVAACAATPERVESTDYSSSASWYDAGGEGYATDLFYITPTCTWSKEDDSGVLRYNMDVSDTAQCALTHGPSELARRALGSNSNFYCPYYAQVSMDTWLTGDSAVINDRYNRAWKDIKNAFEYYLENMNEGRPFIIAGHSQGGRMVVDILRECMNDSLMKKIVAAYVVGYPVTAQDMQSPYIIPATGADDTGVTVAYNSVADIYAMSAMFKGNTLCINPVSWAVDTLPVVSSLGDTVRLDTENAVVVVRGADVDKYYVPSVEDLLPRGNLHIGEYDIFMDELQENTQCRIESYLKKNEK